MNAEAKDCAVARALECESALRCVKSAFAEVRRRLESIERATDKLALELDSFGYEPGEDLLEAARGVVRAVRERR